ncbi:MAG: D-2-hydroxyacid dehydrogenase [Thiolinea sp.]
MNTLLILSPEAEAYARLLARHDLPELTILQATTVQQARPQLSSVNLLMGLPEYLAAVLAETPQLQWVQSTSAGVNELCVAGLRRDYQLTNARGVFGELMSEYVFAYLLAQERKLLDYARHQQAGEWVAYNRYPYRRLSELTLGVIGLGSIGQQVARTGAHFGMRVLGMKRTPEPVPAVEQVYGLEQLAEFLPQLDYLVMVLPATPETRHFAHAEFFRLLKPEAVLINVGRGATLDETALVQALDAGQLRQAVLDVFETEPLPPHSPLWTHPGVVLTPHVSALSFPAQIAGLFVENYRRFLRGAALQYPVDFARGY